MVRRTRKKKVNGRRPNPESRETAQAVKLYENFTGHAANRIDTVKIPAYKSAIEVGTVDGLLYTTRRDGETQKYIHKFKQSAKPVFAVSHDGKQIFALGGDFEFTERGIVDN